MSKLAQKTITKKMPLTTKKLILKEIENKNVFIGEKGGVYFINKNGTKKYITKEYKEVNQIYKK